MHVFSEELETSRAKFKPVAISTGSKEKNWYLEGIYGEAELLNNNRRWYPLDVMSNAVDRVQDKIKSNQKLLGEWMHPKSDKVNPENACIRIDSLIMEGNQMMGKALVLPGLPKGNLLIGLLNNDIIPPVSTRATGELVEQRDRTLVSSMDLVTVDVVYYQGCQSAVPNAILEVDINWAYNLCVINEQEAQLLEDFRKKASSAQIKQSNQELFDSIMRIKEGTKIFLQDIISKK